jgi:hypothetical protein
MTAEGAASAALDRLYPRQANLQTHPEEIFPASPEKLPVVDKPGGFPQEMHSSHPCQSPTGRF